MTAPRWVAVLDAAVPVLTQALGAQVARAQTTALEAPPDAEGLRLVAALSDVTAVDVGGFLLGAARPYDVEARAKLDLAVLGGEPDARRRRRDHAVMAAALAIAADPTLGGLVDFAELADAEPGSTSEDAGRASHGVSVDLVLTYTAETALG